MAKRISARQRALQAHQQAMQANETAISNATSGWNNPMLMGPSTQGMMDMQRAAEAEQYGLQQTRKAEQAEASLPILAASGNLAAMDAGISPSQRQGLGYQLGAAATPEDQQLAMGLIEQATGSPTVSPVAEQARDQAMADAQLGRDATQSSMASQAANRANQRFNQETALRGEATAAEAVRQGKLQELHGFKQMGRSIDIFDDLMAITGEEGNMLMTGQAKGAYKSLYGQAMMGIKDLYELGAITAADQELIEQLLPPPNEFTFFGKAETQAQFRQARQALFNKLEDKLAFSESPFGVDSFTTGRRSVEDIVSPLPEGAEEIGADELERTQPQGPSGNLAPFGQFMKGIGF